MYRFGVRGDLSEALGDDPENGVVLDIVGVVGLEFSGDTSKAAL